MLDLQETWVVSNPQSLLFTGEEHAAIVRNEGVQERDARVSFHRLDAVMPSIRLEHSIPLRRLTAAFPQPEVSPGRPQIRRPSVDVRVVNSQQAMVIRRLCPAPWDDQPETQEQSHPHPPPCALRACGHPLPAVRDSLNTLIKNLNLKGDIITLSITLILTVAAATRQILKTAFGLQTTSFRKAKQ